MTRKLSLTVDGKNVAVYLHKGDLPDSVSFNGAVAVDSETLGLSLIRDNFMIGGSVSRFESIACVSWAAFLSMSSRTNSAPASPGRSTTPAR